MYGILADDPDAIDAVDADVAYLLSERTTGERVEPVAGATTVVACWGDTATVRDDPSLAAVTEDGTRATTDADGHHWGTVCPTDDDYRAALLDRIETVGADGDVRLTTTGFPGEEFCHCDRCDRRFDADDFDDRTAWRSAIVTDFVADAADRVAGDLVVTLYPDPYPGALRERTGLDPAALEPHVDGFLVPLCSLSYETTYWVETLARGFDRELADLDAELTFQLSAEDVDVDRLTDLARQVEPYADAVVFGTHRCTVDDVAEVIDRLRRSDRSDQQQTRFDCSDRSVPTSTD